MDTLGVVLGRTGSKGLKDKNFRTLCGKPVAAWTLETAQESKYLTNTVFTTDADVESMCAYYGAEFIQRPRHLLGDRTRIDDIVRHAVDWTDSKYGSQTDLVVILYANVPVRSPGIVDRVVRHFLEHEADSVQTMVDVGKYHPMWLYKLDNRGRAKPSYGERWPDQRQDLPKFYALDSSCMVVSRECLERGREHSDPHHFWGVQRFGLIQEEHDTVDIDTLNDFYRAEAILRDRQRKGV